jgi:hypothetical protein
MGTGSNVPNRDPDNESQRPASTTWSLAEERAINQAIRNIRATEDATGTHSRDVKFWTMVSDEVGRTPSACKNYWSRRGRKWWDFDERRGKQRSKEMITSRQKRKKKN